MASGGYHPNPNKQSKSDSLRRSNWQRSVSSERDDAQSMNSLPSDIRINNWDLADLHPVNLGGDSKRRKKSKGNPEREREQSLSMDSPPRGGELRHHSQSSFPRTKINPSTPKSQKISLENLKLQMMFGDFDYLDNADGERNNERRIQQIRSRLHNTSMNRMDPNLDMINQNNNVDTSIRDSAPDSKEIVTRLVQIRDFMKQARTMLESMERMGDRKKPEDVEKVRRLIQNLQDQEHGYKGLLQNTLQIERQDDSMRREGDDSLLARPEVKEEMDDSSVDLEVQTQNSETSDGSQDNSSRPRIEDKLGLGFEDEEQIQGATGGLLVAAGINASSNNTLDQLDGGANNGAAASAFPVQETEEGAKGGAVVDGGSATLDHQELVRILNEKQQQLQALMSRQEELNGKRREAEKRLMEAQARDNKARTALAAVASSRELLQQFRPQGVSDGPPRLRDGGGGGEPSQLEERGAAGEDGVLKSNIVGYPESDDEDNSNVREVNATLPTELMELRRELNFLRNEFSQAKDSPNNMETDTDLAEMGRQQLQNKLQELQNKKSSMDKLLHELQSLHSQPLLRLQRNNEPSNASPASKSQSASNIPARPPPIARAPLPNLPPPNPALPSSLQARMKEVASSAPNAVESAMATFSELAARGGDDQTAATMDPKSLEEVQDKLRRLKDVRSQLDQLRDLVEYYQGVKDQPGGSSGNTEEEVFMGDAEVSSQLRHEAARQSRMPSNQNKSSESHLRQQQQQQQLSPQDFSQHQERQHNQQNDTSAGVSGGAQSSLLDLAQLLNLAGNENGDEHSDEDNASVSQSDSQWSNLGPWDDDPEIQEKVRKLKAAKEKLRHLQDLVAFVQQSPEGGNALPQTLGELAASVEGEAVSQATQTDEPNVSVSEGEVPIDEPQRPSEEEASMENAQVELQQLRKERARLLDLQNQLKHLQSVVGRGNEEESTEARGRREEMCGNEKTEQAPNATVVTFASNDELYSKMRRQRILREELRSKKKELEAIMKKDRNKRQYSRNQDNQSDTVSLNTDTFGIPASVDATMATWGGSTVDNLENITEDEDGNADEDDDGYPSDGIVQVEEEEEENDTDNGTYTIEADARQRKNMRKPGHMGIGARPKTSRGRQTFPQPAYTDQSNATKKVSKKTKRNAQSNQRESKIRQENYRSAEDLIHESEEDVKGKNPEWFRLMENRLNNLSSSVESLVKKLDTSGGRQLSVSLSQENTSPTFVPPMQEQMLQLQNQSMMLSFSHIVQSLARQQGDMQQLQQQMQNLQLVMHDANQDHSFQNITGGAPPSSQLRPSVSTSALNNSSSFYPLSATGAPQMHQLPSPFPQMNLNNSMSNTLMSHGPFGQGPGLPGHLGSLQHNTFPTGANNLGSNFSLHQQHGSIPSSSFAQGGRDFSQQLGNQFHNSSHTQQQLDSTAGAGAGASQFSNLFPSSQQSHEREEMDESSLDRMNAYLADKKGEADSWAKKYDYYSSQGLQMSTPKLENLEAERRRQPNDKGRRGPIGREDSSDLTPFAPLYGSSSGLDDAGAGGETSDGITKLHLSSSYSSIQSIKDEHSRIKQEQGQAKSSNTDESNTLFESLRDTIYTEVASLISQNENRPHFLLELFREVRQIDSDLLRQRTLYSVQELVNSYLKSSSVSNASHKPAWLNTPLSTQETANSDQTPSESVVTSEDDEDPHVSRLLASGPAELKTRSKLPKFPFDYELKAENPSPMSASSNLEDAPFFQDALGETVIEFESLKKKARPQMGKLPKLGEGAFLASEHLFRDMRGRPGRKGSKQKASDSGNRHVDPDMSYGDGASNSGVDQASESSMSDMPYPRIDMKQLDLQIKQVMMETIPVVKEHMEDVCSSQLLAYIKRLVLSLTTQTGNQEFARFFHRQLSSILQDTLEKYEGRKMRECGEDLLVEISDVLFNELAFFRLMEDIEDPNEMERLRGTAVHAYQGRRNHGQRVEDENEEGDSSFNEDGEMEVERVERDGREKTSVKTNQRGFHISEAEQEQLGRERDDELASEMVQDGDDQDEDDDTEHSYKIELAPSETKPFTRIGSDEDDDNSDEEQSIEDFSETAVSRNDAKMGTSLPSSGSQQQPVNNGPPPVRPETEGAWGEGDKEKQDVDKPLSPSKLVVLNGGDQSSRSPSHQGTQMNGSMNGGHDDDDDDDDDDQELTVNDLPERLTVGSSSDTTPSADTAAAAAATTTTNSTDLRRKYEEEKMSLSGIEGVLASLEGIQELAGDDITPMDPDSFLS